MTVTPTQPRAERKRRDVLEATLRLLSRDGPRGVTHRAVAAEAGTSVRGITYYFASREDLLRAALTHYATTAIARFDAIRPALETAGALDARGAADLLAAIVLSDLVEDRAGLVAEYELVLEIGREGSLAAPYREWQSRLESLLQAYARRMGSRHPGRDARLVLATLRGLEIEALARPEQPVDGADLRAMFRTLLRGLGLTRRRRRAPRVSSRGTGSGRT